MGRKIRYQEIAVDAAANAMKEFEQDWHNPFIKIDLTDIIASSASSLALKYSLKGADAIHLASAISAKTTLFVVSDKQLLKVSEVLDLKAYNPAKGFFRQLLA